MKESLLISLFVVVNSILVVASKEENNQAVVREIWSQVRGDSIQNLLADVRFPHKPSKVTLLSTFDAPVNDGAHFAQRLKGYFIAPKTGEYKFYSSCDDECEIFLGLDGKEGENNRIISQRKSSMHNEFDRFPDQVSHTIFLEKGKSYYLEEIGRQSTGRENLSLGVELPDGKRFFPIPNKYLSKYNKRSSKKGLKSKSRGLKASSKTKKKQHFEKESSEMIEGSMGKLLVSANGEKKSMKSEDYPEENGGYTESNQPSAQAHAVLEVEGAEIDDGQATNGKGTQEMFPDKSAAHGSMEEFELSPKLEVTSDVSNSGLLNEAGIEKAVEDALRQRNDNNDVHANEVAFAGDDKSADSEHVEGHSAEASKEHHNEVAEKEGTPVSKGNDTVLEMNKIASEAGQVAMNLVNVTNFKVVIPGGKTYQISGTPGNKPSVTVVPEAEEHKEAATQKDTTANATSAKSNEAVTPKPEAAANPKASNEDSVTAVQHGNAVDVHVNKKDDYHNPMEVPGVVQTAMDHHSPEHSINSPIMGSPALSHPAMASPAMGTPGIVMPLIEHPHPILDSSVASLMYHPEEHHMPLEHPVMQEHAPMEPHGDNMHIEVNSTVPVHPAPKPQNLDPEVIKVEFLPEGISVDTAASKISKKCNHGKTASKKSSTTPSECKDDNDDEKASAKTETSKPEASVKAETTKPEVSAAIETMKPEARTKTETQADKAAIVKSSNDEGKSIVTGKVVATAPQADAKMFAAPVVTKGVPGDVTVVPAERQGAVTRVLVQDLAAEKNETKMNIVKTMPLTKEDIASPFPTITGSVMNNVTGKPVPFEVKLVSSQKEAQELAGGHGANFTISADSRTFASGVATGTNKKGQQQTIVILPEALQKQQVAKATADKSAPVQPTQRQPAQQQPQQQEKKPAVEKTFPVTMDDAPSTTFGGGGGGGGGGATGEFIFPDMSNLNPGSDPSVVSASAPGIASPSGNQNNQIQGLPQSNIAAVGPQQQQSPDQMPQAQTPGQDNVLIGPPDNIYHGPVLSSVASEFMTDLNKGAFSTADALDLMNNYVSGSQDMTSSIKKLQGVLGKVHTRDNTASDQGGIVNSPAAVKLNGLMFKGAEPPNANVPPMNNAPMMNNVPNLPMDNKPQMMNMKPQRFNSQPSSGEIAALLAIGPNKEYMRGNNGPEMGSNMGAMVRETGMEDEMKGEQGSYFNRPENHYENHEENYEPNTYNQEQNSFRGEQSENGPNLAQINQMSKEKPPPVHMFQEFDPHAIQGESRSNMMGAGQQGHTLPEMPMGHFNPPQQGQAPPEMGQYNTPMGQIAALNEPSFPHNPMQDNRQEYIRNNVDSFLNRIDPHELSPNPSVAMPENGLARHTLSKRPSQQQLRPNIESMRGGLIGPDRMNNFAPRQQKFEDQGYKQRPSVESFHGNNPHGNAISDMYTDSLFPEDIADIESLRGSLQGKTLSAFDRQEEAQAEAHAQGRSEVHPNKEHQLKVSFPLRGVTKARFKGATRSNIARWHKKLSKRKKAAIGRRQVKSAIRAKKSTYHRRKLRNGKNRRDLVSIVPAHRPKAKSDEENEEDIILNAETVAKEAPVKTVSQQLAKITTEANEDAKPSPEVAKVTTEANEDAKPSIEVAKVVTEANQDQEAKPSPEVAKVTTEATEDAKPSLEVAKVVTDASPEAKGSVEAATENSQVAADTKDSMTDIVRHRHDIDKGRLRNIAMELKDILKQLHHSKKTSFDIWEGNKATGKSIMTNRVGSNYEIQYVKGKVTDDDLLDKASPTYQSPDAERFQQDVWEPGSRGEGTMLGALVNSKRGFLAKARAPRKGRKSQRSELQRVPKSQIARHQDGYRPYFKDWKLDDEIRLLQQL